MAKEALQQALELLDASDATHTPLSALRQLRNALVGNTGRKLACVEDIARVTRLAKLLSSAADGPDTLQIKAQVAAILGVLSLPNDLVLVNLLLADVPTALWTALREATTLIKDEALPDREARDLLVCILRALKSFYAALVSRTGPRVWGAITLPAALGQSEENIKAGKMRARVDQLPVLARSALAEAFKHDNVFALLSTLTEAANAFLLARQPDAAESSSAPAAAAWHATVAELSCEIMANTVRTAEQQIQLLSQENLSRLALKALVHLVQAGQIKVEEAALNAISAIIHDSQDAALALDVAAEMPTGVMWLFVSKFDARSTTTQLAAAQCFAHFVVASGMDKKDSAPAAKTAVATLIRLVAEREGLEAQAMSTLAYLVAPNESLQHLACETGVLRLLAELFGDLKAKGAPEEPIKLQKYLLTEECILLLIARLSASRDELRRRVAEESLLPYIVAALPKPFVTLRIAACECVKVLSRSANVLRTGLMESGVGAQLFDRLADKEDDRVRVVALAAVSNLVSDFSPAKDILLSKGIMPRLVEISRANSGMLRLNAVSALVNMVYWSETPLKRKLMDALTWDYLVALMQDSDVEVQEQAVCLLRNLAMGNEADITMSVSGIGEGRLYSVLEEKLRSSHQPTVQQALYTLVNISSGNEAQRRPIISRPGLTRGLLAHMSHANIENRMGAVWAVHNLARGVHDNVVRLRQLGFEAKLRDMQDDLSVDVRERVSETLAVFTST